MSSLLWRRGAWGVYNTQAFRWTLRMLLVVLVASLAASANAAVNAAGPRLAVVRFRFLEPRSVDLLTIDEAGRSPFRLLGRGKGGRIIPAPLSAPAWSPNGDLLAFAGLTPNRSGGAGVHIRSLFVILPDGSGLRHLPGTRGAYGPVFAPSGKTVVYARRRTRGTKRQSEPQRFESTAIWAAQLNGAAPHPLTRWRNGLEQVPSSFSPDGSTLAISRIDELRSGQPEAVLWRLGTEHRQLLARNGREPVFSPDGLRIALIRKQMDIRVHGSRHAAGTPELFVVSRDGAVLRRLTNVSGGLLGAPNWDPSGERLTYSQTTTRRYGLSTTIMEVNADGSCRTKVLDEAATLFFAATWQPGQSRGADRIECGEPSR